MKIGGYQIINLKGKNLTTDVGMVYEGLYELIEGTRKPILLSGIQVDDVEYQDVFAELSVNGSNLELKAYNKVFTIQDNNVVIVSDDSSGGGGSGDIAEQVTIYVNDNPITVFKDSVINNILKLGNFLHQVEAYAPYYYINLPFSVSGVGSSISMFNTMNESDVSVYDSNSESTYYLDSNNGSLSYADIFEEGMTFTFRQDV